LDGQGDLAITARSEEYTGSDGISRHYTSARLNTQGKVEVEPGSYVEAQLRAPVGPGLRPAFWLIGSDFARVGWPACGELDVMEGTQRSSAMVRQTIHLSRLSHPKDDAPYGENAPGGYTTLSGPRDRDVHSYGVYFDGNLVQFYVDRRPTLRFTAQEALEHDRAWPFDRPQVLVLNLAVGGNPDGAKMPATMTVGSISIWGQGVPF
jgi:beta-glucanase (GH16 family)